MWEGGGSVDAVGGIDRHHGKEARMKHGLAFVSALVLGLAAFAGSAAAAPNPTPNEFVGACNMVASWPGAGPGNGVGVQPGGGMELAMSVDNPNGNDGMFHAVFVSGNGDC
jgi:hypothetical protein